MSLEKDLDEFALARAPEIRLELIVRAGAGDANKPLRAKLPVRRVECGVPVAREDKGFARPLAVVVAFDAVLVEDRLDFFAIAE